MANPEMWQGRIALTQNQRLALFRACFCNYMHKPDRKHPHGLLTKERAPSELARAMGAKRVHDPHGTYKTLERLGLTGWDGYTYATPKGMALMRKLLKLPAVSP